MPTDDRLEREIGQALRSLPAPRAPRTLLPRVLAAVQRPWYARAWRRWPVEAQLASAIGLVAVVIAFVWLARAVPELDTAAALARIGWRQLVLPAVGHLFAVAVLMTLTLTVSVAAITRIAFGGLPE